MKFERVLPHLPPGFPKMIAKGQFERNRFDTGPEGPDSEG